jgi:hypothetical protein
MGCRFSQGPIPDIEVLNLRCIKSHCIRILKIRIGVLAINKLRFCRFCRTVTSLRFAPRLSRPFPLI